MQVFKAFFKIAWKNRVTLFIYSGIFLVLMGMYASMETKSATKFESKKAKIAVFDYDNSEASKYLVEYLKQTHNVVDVEDDDETLENYILYQKIDYVLYIKQNYSENGNLYNMKRSGTYIGAYVDSDIENFQNTMNMLTGSGYTNKEAYNKTLELLNPEELVELSKKTEEKNMVYYFYLYLPYVVCMLLFVGVGPVIMTFNKKEISNRTEISSLSIKNKTIQIVLGTISLTAVLWMLFVILSVVMCKEKLFEANIVYILLNTISFTIMGIGMVSVISNFDLSINAINGISNILSLGMAFLGGIFVPMEFFGKGVKFISNFIPTHWYVVAHNNIFNGGSKAELFKCYGLQLLFGLAFLSIAMLVAKKNRVEKA